MATNSVSEGSSSTKRASVGPAGTGSPSRQRPLGGVRRCRIGQAQRGPWRIDSALDCAPNRPSLSLSPTTLDRSSEICEMCTKPSSAGRMSRIFAPTVPDQSRATFAPHSTRPTSISAVMSSMRSLRLAGRAAPCTDAIFTVPSFSMVDGRAVSSVIVTDHGAPLPMTSRIFSGSIFRCDDVGAHSDMFSGAWRAPCSFRPGCAGARSSPDPKNLHDLCA